MDKLKKWMKKNSVTYGELGRRVNRSKQTIYNIVSGRRMAGPQLAQTIEDVTEGVVRRSDLRPDIWP